MFYALADSVEEISLTLSEGRRSSIRTAARKVVKALAGRISLSRQDDDGVILESFGMPLVHECKNLYMYWWYPASAR
ncbi:hypothetical protein PsorP6_009724 [Peronosclerospora sorghi]|uniref:Uncharacterized protein n=1 Tax=Peronosclerospora sorghi TaxID=230839 RepID=A0ACC0VZU3_9STRA|nr:hypothetical protein PsorP6_009724 [Peronosclerospora sorghi]